MLQINSAYQEAFESKNRYLLLFGGAGSGKSYFAAQKVLLRILNEWNHRILVLRKVKDTIKESIYNTFCTIITENNWDDNFYITKNPMNILCRSNNNEILFSGLDDVSKLKSISNITSILIEEAFELTQDDFLQIDLRLRGETPNYKQIIMAFNPEDESHWLHDLFFRRKVYKDILKVHTTYLDNTMIDDDYKNSLVNAGKANPDYKRVYLEGKWGQKNQYLVFTNWEVDNTISENYDDHENISGGIDWGFSHASVYLAVSYPNEDELIIFDEIYHKNKTKDVMYKALGQRERILITVDSAEPDALQEMRSLGFDVKGAKKGKHSVVEGVEWLKRKRIRIHSKCNNLIREISNYSHKYDPKTNQVFMKEFKTVNDDTIAALRYAVEDFRLDNENKITSAVNPYWNLNTSNIYKW